MDDAFAVSVVKSGEELDCDQVAEEDREGHG